jgi:hypothetical protein
VIREWTVIRSQPNGQAVVGSFELDTGLPCASLERLAVQIPEGRYLVTLTPSTRATQGSLWAPYDDHRLPLLHDVPGRTAVRIHSGNHVMDSQGCILVGSEHDATELMHSRPALTRVVNDLRTAESVGDQVWLTVRSAT